MVVYDFLFDEAVALPVSAVEINGSHEGFECIAEQIAVVRIELGGANNVIVYAEFERQAIELLALYYFGASVGEIAFAPVGEVFVEYVGYDGVEYGIAEKFEPFVIFPFAVVVFHRGGFVAKGLFVKADIVRIESQYIA
jgi:hypothetical protein